MKFVHFKHANFAAASPYAHLCCEHFAECSFTHFMEYSMGFTSKQNLKPAAFPSVHKAPKQTGKHGTLTTATISTTGCVSAITVAAAAAAETVSEMRKKNLAMRKSNMKAYSRRGSERKRLYTNACGKERKNKPQMLVANEN